MKDKKFTFRQKLFPTFDEGIRHMESGSFLLRWARTFAMGGALLYVSYQGVGNNIEYSEGTRTGMINKISEKGLAFKTYEGQMALEGIVSGNN